MCTANFAGFSFLYLKGSWTLIVSATMRMRGIITFSIDSRSLLPCGPTLNLVTTKKRRLGFTVIVSMCLWLKSYKKEPLVASRTKHLYVVSPSVTSNKNNALCNISFERVSSPFSWSLPTPAPQDFSFSRFLMSSKADSFVLLNFRFQPADGTDPVTSAAPHPELIEGQSLKKTNFTTTLQWFFFCGQEVHRNWVVSFTHVRSFLSPLGFARFQAVRISHSHASIFRALLALSIHNPSRHDSVSFLLHAAEKNSRKEFRTSSKSGHMTPPALTWLGNVPFLQSISEEPVFSWLESFIPSFSKRIKNHTLFLL